jgi:uracil-DNA glycosylase
VGAGGLWGAGRRSAAQLAGGCGAVKQPIVAAPRQAEAQRIAERAPAPPPMPLAPLAMPDDWDDFHRWLAEDPAVPGTAWHPRRVLPTGPQAAPLMILSLCPEMADQDSGTLYSGDAGKLLDAMLRAIGLQRAQCYAASLALTRPPGGRVDAAQADMLVPLLWHQLRLARPERLLLFGGDLVRLVTGADIAALRGELRLVNHVGVNVEVVAVQHPMLLLDRPIRKAAAWDSLKRLARG